MKKSVTQNIKLSILLLNIENPRFEMGSNQRDIVQKMIEDQGDKLYHLAKHIVQHGLNPSELAIVTPSEREDGRYEVLEGNRRITALKILSNPTLIDPQYKNLTNKIKKLSLLFKKNPIREVPCVIFSDPKDAYEWIKLKHTGQNGGVGTVEWDTQQQGRFDAKIEGKAPNAALQIIDYLNKSPLFDKGLKAKLKDVPATSLGRLTGDPDFRDFLGLTQKDGVLYGHLKDPEVVKGLTKVVKDLLSPDFTVNDIYYKEDRKKYIESFTKSEIPDTKKRDDSWELGTPTSSSITTSTKAKKKSSRLSTDRKALIPREFIVKITDKRVHTIYNELKNLKVDDFENAGAVLFRVLLELSIDCFIHEKKITKVGANSELYKKVTEVANYLETNSILTKQQLKPIRTAASNPNSMLAMNTFNAYVHNRHVFPSPKELKITWDNMQTFAEKILEAI
jgi:hypothetical protein